MERDEIQARIAAIRAELGEKVAELDCLLAKLGEEDRGDGGRPKFTIIRGGLGALALPVTVLGRRPRHPLGVGLAAAVTGALAVVLVVPAHTTPGGPGDVISYLSIPGAPPPSIAAPAAGTPTRPSAPAPATPHSSAPTAAAPVPAQPAPEPAASIPAAPPSSPAPSSPLPSPTPPRSTSQPPSTPPSTSPDCLVKVALPPILRVCVKL